MTGKASSLVAQAKEWATYYGNFTKGEEGAAYTVPLKVRAAWDSNDADAIADVFTDNGSMLVGDQQLRGRDEIRSYLAAAFDGGWNGTKLTEEPEEIRLITADVALAVTRGGTVAPGATEVDPDQLVRAMYVIVKQDGAWRLASHQTCPIKG